MNKNEAKTVKIKDVVEVKADGAKLVVSKINEYETGKFKFTGYDKDANKYKTYEHADLKLTGKTGELPEKTATARKVRVPKFEELQGAEFTQKEYDKMGTNAKRNLNLENTVVYPDPDNDGFYLSKTVGSTKILKLAANSLNNAKRVRNTIG